MHKYSRSAENPGGTGSEATPDLFVSTATKPKYGQIQDRILEKICSGQWPPGNRIPPERELAKKFAASVGTVRNALQYLVNQGYLHRVQGRGTFVNKSIELTDSLRYFRFSEDFKEQVEPLTIRCLGQPRTAVCPEAAAALEMDAATRFFKVRRIFLLRSDPLVYVVSYLRQSLFTDFDRFSVQTLEELPIYLLIEKKYNMPTLATRERFSAVAATARVAGHLNLTAGAPVLKIAMVAFTTRNTPYEYQVSYCDTTAKQICRD